MAPVTAGPALVSALPEYRPYRELGDTPNLIVDGAPLESTRLTLSHWPNNATPDALKRDTSTEICFAYLDQAEFHVEVPAVSNNHFDEDGLFSMLAVTRPELALAHRDLLVDASRAGDFGRFATRDAARLAFAIETCADPATSPLEREVFNACQARRVAPLYRAMLDYLPRLLDDLDAARELWQAQDIQLDTGLEIIDSGRASIYEVDTADLAVIDLPVGLPAQRARRYLEAEFAVVHPFAIHANTGCSRLLRRQGKRYELQFRYEGWVQLATHRPALRVSLADLADELNRVETAPGTWIGEAVTEVAPRLYLDGCDASSLAPDYFLELVLDYLGRAPVAWDPYDWPPAAAGLQETA
jgi:hypothetical protein